MLISCCVLSIIFRQRLKEGHTDLVPYTFHSLESTIKVNEMSVFVPFIDCDEISSLIDDRQNSVT
jgi:hypothetical protein